MARAAKRVAPHAKPEFTVSRESELPTALIQELAATRAVANRLARTGDPAAGLALLQDGLRAVEGRRGERGTPGLTALWKAALARYVEMTGIKLEGDENVVWRFTDESDAETDCDGCDNSWA